MVACRKDCLCLLLLLNCRGIGRCVTWHVYVYHRVTGNSIYNFEEKANRKMDEEGTKTKQKKVYTTTNYCPSLPKKRRGREGGEKKRSEKGGSQDRGKYKRWWEHKAEIVYCSD